VTPVEPAHVNTLGWLLEHLREELGLFGGGFVAFWFHELSYRLWRKQARALMRLVVRRRE
jgi:hypothetical protein